MMSGQVTWLEKQINKAADPENNRSITSPCQLRDRVKKSKCSVAFPSFWGIGEFPCETYQRFLRAKEWFKWNLIDFVFLQELSTGHSLSDIKKKSHIFTGASFQGTEVRRPCAKRLTDKCWPCVCLNRWKWNAKRLKFKGGTLYLRNVSSWNSTSSRAQLLEMFLYAGRPEGQLSPWGNGPFFFSSGSLQEKGCSSGRSCVTHRSVSILSLCCSSWRNQMSRF